jgi:hypothetical protein
MADIHKDIVFVRTEMGQNEAYDPASDMPRMLRTLLFSIDGRSTAGNYAALLPNFGDVYAHLDLLHEAGYIRVSNSRSRRLSGAGEAAETASRAGDSIPTGMRSTQFEASTPPRTVPQDSRWQVSHVPPLEAAATRPRESSSESLTPTRSVGGLLRKVLRLVPRGEPAAKAWGQSQQFAASVVSEMPAALVATPQPTPAVHAPPAPQAPLQAPPLGEAACLQAARELMIDFLHLYLPAIAHEASMSIEALLTREQMMRSLPDYSLLVSRTGEAGAAHLLQLHLTLGVNA